MYSKTRNQKSRRPATTRHVLRMATHDEDKEDEEEEEEEEDGGDGWKE
jgi:hypothetical protein